MTRSNPNFLNRYVDSDGNTYRVCHLRNGDGSAGRLMLIVRHGGRTRAGDKGPALELSGMRAKRVLAALAAREAAEKGGPLRLLE